MRRDTGERNGKAASGEYWLYSVITGKTILASCDMEREVDFTVRGGSGRFGTIQMFTVPRNSRYLIKARGARGGTHSYNYGESPGTYYGGKGAFIEGKFRLDKGTVLNIVGQRGGDSVEVKGGQSTSQTAAQLGKSVEDNAGTGGGGGSFVYTDCSSLTSGNSNDDGVVQILELMS